MIYLKIYIKDKNGRNIIIKLYLKKSFIDTKIIYNALKACTFDSP